MKSIFLSHNHNDRPFVKRISNYLSQYGIKCWVDEAEIKIGESLIDKVGNAIIDCDYFAVILSEHSINSQWVKKELNIALTKEINNKRVVVLPIILGKIQPPPFLLDKLYISFIDDDTFDERIAQLIHAMEVTDNDILDLRNSSYIWHELIHNIEIKDKYGKNAIWEKTTIVTPIRNDIKLWYDQELHGSGRLNVISTKPGKVKSIFKEGGAYTVVTEFPIPLNINERISKSITLEVTDCFLSHHENITWIPIGSYSKLVFNLKLPDDRPFKSPPNCFCYLGSTKLQLKKISKVVNNCVANFTIENPQPGIKYLIDWEW